jgi:uncharacterized membrane protein YccF (DUF307 family)
VLLDPLKTVQFPMGLHAVQGVDMMSWIGERRDPQWQALQREVESRIAPRWVLIKTEALENALAREQRSREGLDARFNALRDQSAREEQAREDMTHERDRERDRAETLKSRLDAASTEQRKLQGQLRTMEEQQHTLAAQVSDATQAREALERNISELKPAREAAVTEARDLRQRLTQAEVDLAQQSRSLGEIQARNSQLSRIDPTVRQLLAQRPISTPAFLLRLLWILSGGLVMAIFWVLAGVLMGLSLIGWPWMWAAFRIGTCVLFPFLHEAVPADISPDRIKIGSGPLAFLRNLVWFIFAGWWLILLHLLLTGLLAMTVVFIPFAWVHLKIVWIALWPVGKVIVPVERASFPFGLPEKTAARST